jgi:hypothetical protein
LAQYNSPLSNTELEEAATHAGEPFAAEVSLAPDAIGLFPSETHPARRRAVPQEASPTPSDSGLALVGDRPAAQFTLPEPEPCPLASSSASSTPGDPAQTRSDDEDLEHSRIEATSTSGVAVSASASAVDLPGAADLAGEIAHLQALIEGLTQTIEWRSPSVTGR